MEAVLITSDFFKNDIIDLLSDPVRSLRLSENAYSRIKSFELDKIVQEHQLILE